MWKAKSKPHYGAAYPPKPFRWRRWLVVAAIVGWAIWYHGHGAIWVGAVSLKPGGVIAPHHHGRHEVAIGITSGRMEVKWGGSFEHSTELGPGDFAYFTPGVPH
jgi:uncharacterized RmlC-like cupin family protein